MPGQGIVTIRDKQWSVSIASTPWELTQGLGGITEIPENTGVFFDTGFEQYITVSTEAMLFPLDVAFLSESLVVVDLVQHFVPGHRITSVRPARFFVEVNAGEMDGIDLDDQAYLELLPLQEVPVMPDWTTTIFSFMGLALMAAFMVGTVTPMLKSTFSSSSNPDAGEPEIIEEKHGVVLARWRGEWVTWLKTPRGGYVLGHYFQEEEPARKDYQKRAAEHAPYYSRRGSNQQTEKHRHYYGPYLTNWQYGGYSYVEEDAEKPPDLWVRGMVDYANPHDVLDIAQAASLKEVSLAGGFWKEIGYEGYGQKLPIDEAYKAWLKAKRHVLGPRAEEEDIKRELEEMLHGEWIEHYDYVVTELTQKGYSKEAVKKVLNQEIARLAPHSPWLTAQQREDLQKKYGAVAVRWAEEATVLGDIEGVEAAAEYYAGKLKEVFGLGHLSPELSAQQIRNLRELLGLTADVAEILRTHRRTGYIS